ncbi:hypothetical protein [Pseudomonas sp. RGM2987]|uniref:hypothetical protein n=1 Tax=Pseudomonas sp. RGM2987 TaxID=2930090 RepID=UPI002469A536|nr:hypothetical protein [Pseudomonas sp. RGM2987]
MFSLPHHSPRDLPFPRDHTALLLVGMQRAWLDPRMDVAEIPDQLDEAQRHARGIIVLPTTLAQALDCLRNSGALRETLPAPLLDTYFALKAQEPAWTQALPPAERCEHYARIY